MGALEVFLSVCSVVPGTMDMERWSKGIVVNT